MRPSKIMMWVCQTMKILELCRWGMLLTALLASGLSASGAVAAELDLRGEPVQGGLMLGKVSPGSTVALDGANLPVSEQGDFVFGFDRDAPGKSVLKVRDADGRESVQILSITRRQYDVQRVNGIAQQIMSPSADDLRRIQKESELVGVARAVRLPRTDFVSPFRWPLQGPVTGVFGSQRVYNGEPGRPHYGVDVAAPVGTPVSTPATGVVTLAESDLFYSGGTVIIDHGHGLSSTLMHLSKVLVKVGQEVKPGDVIGAVGATGRASGPHLDWRMNWRAARVDPQRLVPPMPAAPKGVAAGGTP